MTLTVEDTMVNRDRIGELKRVLEKVFAERCGLPMEVSFCLCARPGQQAAQTAGELRWRRRPGPFTGRTTGTSWKPWAEAALPRGRRGAGRRWLSPKAGGQEFVGAGQGRTRLLGYAFQQAASGDVGARA